MSTTGAVFPGSAEDVSEAPWSDNAWTTPANITADDGFTAQVTPANFDAGDQTQVLKAYNFDLSAIPDGSTIDGVICRVNAWYAAGTGSLDLCQLLDTSRAKVGTNHCATPVALTADDTTIITEGGEADTWGNSLTAAWVKNANFGVALGIIATQDNSDVFIDYVTLEVYYTAGAGEVAATAAVYGVLKETASAVATGYSIFKEAVSNTAAGQAIIKMATGVTAAGAAVLKETATAVAIGYAALKETASVTANTYAALKETVSQTAIGQAVIEMASSVTAIAQAVIKETASATAVMSSYLQDLGAIQVTRNLFAVLIETASNTAVVQAVIKMASSAAATGYAVLKEAVAQTAAGQAVIKMTTSATATLAAYLQDLAATQVARNLYAVLKETASSSAALQTSIRMVSAVTAGGFAWLQDRVQEAAIFRAVFEESPVVTAGMFCYLTGGAEAPPRRTVLEAMPRPFTLIAEDRRG